MIRKKLNLDLVLKDVEKYCYSEISYEKIKNLEKEIIKLQTELKK